MYEQYYGFTRTPFRLESEPDMFFFGESQVNVLECIKLSLTLRKGIITLSGLPGTGKTTVMRRAIEESIVPDTVICRINRARTNHFLDTLKREILARQKKQSSINVSDITLHQLVENAVKDQKHFLVVIDESQQLTPEEVDELFSLVSIEKDSRKHFKFLLVSHQPFHEYFDIEKYTNSDELLSNHCFLLPLLQEEILPYIEHRLSNTGWNGTPEFAKQIEHLVFMVTQGIPRRINSFFDRLMLFSFFENENKISEAFVKHFCQDLLIELNAQSHPDLDSFDLRQSLRRGRRHFIEEEAVEVSQASNVINITGRLSSANGDGNANDKTLSLGGVPEEKSEKPRESQAESAEPLASDDPEALILFVSSFTKNPERFKNYTDQYYKIPKNLTLLLCLATETNHYIEDITPPELIASSAIDIKCMIAIFIEKMLITSRFDKHRVLGLDYDASEDEINRHFSYMMRLCRSEYVKSNKQEFEAVIKDAYIKLLSERNTDEEEIPVVDDVLSSIQAAVVPKPEDTSFDDEKADDNADQKLAALENAKKMLGQGAARSIKAAEAEKVENSAGVNTLPNTDPFSPNKNINSDKKKSFVLPAAFAGVAVAATVAYVFLGSSVMSTPETQSVAEKSEVIASAKLDTQVPPQLVLLPELKKKAEKMVEEIEVMRSVKESALAVEKIAKKPLEKVIETPKKVAVTKPVVVDVVRNEAKQVKKTMSEKQLQEILRQAERLAGEGENKKTSQKKVIVNITESNVPVPDKRKSLAASEVLVSGVNSTSNNEVGDKESGFDQTFLERIQLNRLVNNFKYSYENADLDELSGLFAEDAVTNSGFNRTQILEDYESLFDDTFDRTIQFSNVVWDISDGVATGAGRFTTSVEGDDNIEEKEGSIAIKVVGDDDTKKIVELFFLYQLAEIE